MSLKNLILIISYGMRHTLLNKTDLLECKIIIFLRIYLKKLKESLNLKVLFDQLIIRYPCFVSLNCLFTFAGFTKVTGTFLDYKNQLRKKLLKMTEEQSVHTNSEICKIQPGS